MINGVADVSLPNRASRESQKRPALTLLDGMAIAATLPDLKYLVPGIGLVAGRGAVHMVAGYGYTGKTIACQALALSIASGSELWEGLAVERGRVVHVDMEQGEYLSRRRYNDSRAARGPTWHPSATR